jgi:hypothetical protein
LVISVDGLEFLLRKKYNVLETIILEDWGRVVVFCWEGQCEGQMNHITSKVLLL